MQKAVVDIVFEGDTKRAKSEMYFQSGHGFFPILGGPITITQEIMDIMASMTLI